MRWISSCSRTDRPAELLENVCAYSEKPVLSFDVASQAGGFARIGYLAIDHDRDPVGEIKHEIDFVLDEENTCLAANLLDGGQHLCHDRRRKTLEWFVEQDQFLRRTQGAPDREHLAFAATEVFATGILTHAQLGKQLIDFVEWPAAVALTQHQVLYDGQVWKYTASFWHDRDPRTIDTVRRQRCYFLTGEGYRARRWLQHSHHGPQGRGLAGTVAAEQRHNFTYAHLKIDAAENAAGIVASVNILKREKGRPLDGYRCSSGRAAAARAMTPEIGFQDSRILGDLGRVAFGNHASLMQNGDTVRQREHPIDIVLNQQDRVVP